MAHSLQLSSLSQAPSISDFTPLSEHQTSTPSSFFGGKPVLHAASSPCDLLISPDQVKSWSVFKSLVGQGDNPMEDGREVVARDAGRSSSTSDMSVFGGIGTFVTSSSVILYQTSSSQSNISSDDTKTSAAISIPYQCISIHATQRLYKTLLNSATPSQHRYSALPSSQSTVDLDGTETAAIYLQLDMDPAIRERTNAGDDEDDGVDDRTVEILIVPQSDPSSPRPCSSTGAGSSQEPHDAKVKEMFEALSRCADLHPDELLEDDGGGAGLASMLGFADGGMPGEGGWITSENAHEFEGDFEIDVENGGPINGLGTGAGTRRIRENNSDDDEPEINGDGNEETKWQRTD